MREIHWFVDLRATDELAALKLFSFVIASSQARPGRCWTLNLPPEVTSFIQQVTEELVASGIVGQLLDLVCAFDWVAEAEKLSSERGLGLPKHRKQVCVRCSMLFGSF